MSKLEVKVQKIFRIVEHPNADRMELAIIGGEGGYQTCVGKGEFKSGDLCVYFPIDSVLPSDVEETIFGKDAKVKLKNSRVRTIKLRGALSQGLAVPLHTFDQTQYARSKDFILGEDLTKHLGVVKYEPPKKDSPTQSHGKASEKDYNPNFFKYTDIDHLKNYSEMLNGAFIAVFEKIHGTNFRAGWVLREPKTRWERLKKRLGLFSNWQFVYGSHNVQLQGKDRGKNTKNMPVDVYTKMVKKYDLINRLIFGEVIYAEIYGYGIQKNYHYGCGIDEQKMVVVDLKKDDNYVNAAELLNWSIINGFDTPPLLYIGSFSMLKMDQLAGGPSSLSKDQKVREGIVVRPVRERRGHAGRMIYKLHNPEYLLLKGNSEYH